MNDNEAVGRISHLAEKYERRHGRKHCNNIHIGVCVILLLVIFIVSSCSRRKYESYSSPLLIADVIIKSQSSLPHLSTLSFGDMAFEEYVDRYYHFSTEKSNAGVIIITEGIDAYEIAVFNFDDVYAAKEAQSAFESYLQTRLRDYEGYLPEQAQIVERSRTVREGTLVALLIVPNPEAAEKAFYTVVNDNTSSEENHVLQTTQPSPASPPGSMTEAAPTSSAEGQSNSLPIPEDTILADDISAQITTSAADLPEVEPDPVLLSPIDANTYNHDAVLAAWRSGDDSNLSEKNAAILQAASDLLSNIIVEDMTSYEKELAIHDWMIANAQFDYYNVSHHPEDEPGPDNENPYGFFFL